MAFKSLDQLGLTRVSVWTRALQAPSGLFIICGPSGAELTATSNASVLALNLPPRQRQALDRPEGVQLLETLEGPAVVVGEVNNARTAALAVRAAHAGARVLVELNAPSILSAFTRLGDFNVPASDLRALVRGALAQRLYPTAHGFALVSEISQFETPAEVLAAMDGEVSWPTLWQDGQAKVLQGHLSPGKFEQLLGGYLE